MTPRALAAAVGAANLAFVAASCGEQVATDQPDVGASVESTGLPACSAVALGTLPRPKRAPVKILYLSEPNAALVFEAGFHVDADGAPNAYRSDDQGLDFLANACPQKGRCWGILQRDDGSRVRQGRSRWRYFVTPTSLQDSTSAATDQNAYVDSESIAYLALPLSTLKRLGRRMGLASFPLRLGDVAYIRNKKNGRSAFAIFADLGPPGKIGEGSIALAEALGIPSSPRTGGAKAGLEFLLFLASGDGQTHTQADIDRMASNQFESWGGRARLDSCLNEMVASPERPPTVATVPGVRPR